MRSLQLVVGATLSLIAGSAQAAEPARPHAIGLSLAGGARNQRDDGFNHTRYAGPIGRFDLHYTHHGEADRHHVELGGGGGLGWNRYDRSLLWIDLGLRYDYRHVVAGESIRLWLGGSAGGGPGLFQLREEDSDHVRWLTRYELAFELMVDWRTHDRRGRAHTLEAGLALPLLGLVSQAPSEVTYNNDKPDLGYLLARAHASPRFSSWHVVQAVAVELDWRLRLSPVVEQRVGYRPSWVRASAVAPLVAWTHLLVYRLDFRVGGRR